MMYREFLRLGGFQGYKAPAPWTKEGLEVMPVTECTQPHKTAVNIAVWSMSASVGILLLWSIFMYFFANSQQADAAAKYYLLRCVPAAAIVLAGYVAMSLKAVRAQTLPHHSILVITAIMTVLLMISFGVENFLAFKTEKTTLAPGMLFFEITTLAILLAMLFFYLYLESKIGKNKTENSTKDCGKK